ncbi:hypothetical protein [Mucilaginibacter sp.]|uniref:hypothetical protein n=1 Tax=Mucilaginibacter sp. TaxID=1882438 RepID=UPI002625BCE8|nr:hypothetical protein [Mucilaginibacter sp.]MDB4925003.1 hypothetical protein [Mucilaginibacter sp.]
MKLKIALSFAVLLLCLTAQGATIVSATGFNNSRMVNYAMSKMEQASAVTGNSLVQKTLGFKNMANVVVLAQTDISVRRYLSVSEKPLAAEGFRIIRDGEKVIIIGADEKGAMYGTLDVAEQLRATGGNLQLIKEKKEEPRLSFRGIKFNLPFMAYRSSISLTQQDYVVRDPKFWETFLDMMAANRYNVLSLWSLHPYHYMIRAKNFPEACPFDDAEMQAQKEFWTNLFKMAHDRGIQTYIINWNTFVSPSFALAHKVALYSVKPLFGGTQDTTKLVEQYTRETITQVINEYPELDGLGITIGEAMGGQTPQQRRDWLDRTIFAGMKAANRKIKFVYRAPLSANTGSGGSTSEENDLASRKHIEQQDVQDMFVEFKFNWSHGHSSPKLFMVHGGKLTDKYYNPFPTKYKYVWTMRNEDFYRLRWGNSDFIREFIKNNGQAYVAGCFIGSEIFTPALDYTSLSGPQKTWDYHFQRQWLWYAMWGRLMYDDKTPDATFEQLLAAKYGKGTGPAALQAWKIATNNQLKFASFHSGTADAQLYSEGFCDWAPDKSAHLFDINNIITHPVLDSTLYVNIRDWETAGEKVKPGKMSPLQLAAELDQDNAKLFTLIAQLKAKGLSPGAAVEVNDMLAWYWFGRYFADKIRAGVAVARFRYKNVDERKQAVDYLKQCSSHWANYANAVGKYNKESFPFIITSGEFSLKAMQTQVDLDQQLAVNPAPTPAKKK